MENETKDSALAINDLLYTTVEALSLVKSRTFDRQAYQLRSYTNASNTISSIILNSGSNYVDFQKSYLSFDVVMNSADPTITDENFSFGSGSGLNLISEVVVRSRSGVELDRLSGAALYNKLKIQYQMKQGYTTSGVATAMRYGDDMAINTPITVVLPMSYISPFFTPDKMCPSALVSGINIDITWAPFESAIVKAAGGDDVTSYDVNNLAITMDSITLSSDADQTLKGVAATAGLDWVFESVFNTKATMVAGATSVSIDVQKAVSQGNFVYGTLLQSDRIVNVAVDSLLTDSAALQKSRTQWRLGSHHFPSQVALGNMLFANTLYAYDSLGHFQPDVTRTQFETDSGIAAYSLNKSERMLMSGSSLNSSRTLNFSLDLTAGAAVDVNRDVAVYLCYTKICSAFSDNVAVSL